MQDERKANFESTVASENPRKRNSSKSPEKCKKQNRKYYKPKDSTRTKDKDEDTSCIFCGDEWENSKEKEVWFKCKKCRRWAHQLCAGVSRYTVDFTCDLCSGIIT